MNIFYLDHDPKVAARYLIDSHVNKMIIESCQMLANCYSKEELSDPKCPRSQKGDIRKYSYWNHPCSIWVRESLSNFNWLLEHALEMVEEKRYRTGKGHFSESFLLFCKNNPPTLKDIGQTKPAMAFKSYSHLMTNDPIKSYRAFYVQDKVYDKSGKKINVYTKRDVPLFWQK